MGHGTFICASGVGGNGRNQSNIRRQGKEGGGNLLPHTRVYPSRARACALLSTQDDKTAKGRPRLGRGLVVWR